MRFGFFLVFLDIHITICSIKELSLGSKDSSKELKTIEYISFLYKFLVEKSLPEI